MAVPSRAPDKNQPLLEVQIINREAESFARPKPRHGSERENRVPLLRSKRENRPHLLRREKPCGLARLRARHDKITLLESCHSVAPLSRYFENRRESTENIQHRLSAPPLPSLSH